MKAILVLFLSYLSKLADDCLQWCVVNQNLESQYNQLNTCLPRFTSKVEFCLHKCLQLPNPRVTDNVCPSEQKSGSQCASFCETNHYQKISKEVEIQKCDSRFTPQRMLCGPDGLPYASGCHLNATYPGYIYAQRCSVLLTDLNKVNTEDRYKCMQECAQMQRFATSEGRRLQSSSTLVCATDGKVYTSLAAAIAANATNFYLIDCPSTAVVVADCASTCTTAYCIYSECPGSIYYGKSVCATNGRVYSNFCQNNCTNPNSTSAQFICASNITATQCISQCSQVVCNLTTCANSTDNGKIVCDTSGVAHSNFCYDKCGNSSLVKAIDCPSTMNLTQCNSYCLNVGCLTNNSVCSSNYLGKYTCMTTGVVVLDFCNYFCANRTLGSLLICNTTNTTLCQEQCNSAYCNRTFGCSSSVYNSLTVCSNNNQLYNTTFCQAKCLNSQLTALGTCSAGQTTAQCTTQCTILNCQSVNCSNSAFNNQTVCATNGTAYANFCNASCVDPNALTINYICAANMTFAQCQANCSYSSCISRNCSNSTYNGKLICANNSVIYSNFCSAQCLDSSLRAVLECASGQNATQCQPTCNISACQQNCGNSPYNNQTVCGTDSLIYSNFCSSNCQANNTLSVAMVCTNMSLSQCVSNCSLLYCRRVNNCSSSPYNNKSVCANDGQVYTDFCTSKCLNSSLTFTGECPAGTNATSCLSYCSQLNCQSKCSSNITNTTLVCGNNGVVYSNFCNASCANSSLQAFLVCAANSTLAQCQQLCNTTYCKNITCANSSYNGQQVCVSTAIYTNFCQAKCDNPSLVETGVCPSGFNTSSCQTYCNASTCYIEKDCPNSFYAGQLICANDMKLYSNFCNATCYNSSLQFIYACKSVTNTSLCVSACELAYCLKVYCNNSALTGQLVCGNDNTVYNDFCQASCYSPNTLSISYMCPANQTSAQCTSTCIATNCVKKTCTNSTDNGKIICDTSGNIHTNYCADKCANSSLVKFSECTGNKTLAQCTTECLINTCVNNTNVCSSNYTGKMTCLTNGTVVANYCDVFCLNRSLSAAFICNTSNLSLCQAQCYNYSCTNGPLCTNASTNGWNVCASNGAVYTTFCTSNCLLNNTLSIINICAANMSLASCQSNCTSSLCIRTNCTNSTDNNKTICDTWGQIHTNFCVDKCNNNALTKLTECNSTNLTLCGQQCSYSACLANSSRCSSNYSSKWTCLTDGSLVYNYCSYFCSNVTLNVSFICNTTNQTECMQQCLVARCTSNSTCANSSYNGVSVCANDKKVYTNYCQASCVNASLAVLLNCTANMTTSQCQATCNTVFCQQVRCLNSSYNGQLVCANDGYIYNDFCTVNCLVSNTVTAIYTCPNGQNSTQCQPACDLAYCNNVTCANSTYNGKNVCSTDKVAYSNFCSSQCSNASLVYMYTCPSTMNLTTCNSYCPTAYCQVITCNNSALNTQKVCGNDGVAYTNFCGAWCANSNTLSILFICNNTLNITQCQSTCTTTYCNNVACVSSSFNGKNICATNGNVYTSYCISNCLVNNTLAVSYECPAGSNYSTCQTNCSLVYCKNVTCVNNTNNGKTVCDTSGGVHTDFCGDKCSNPALVKLSECPAGQNLTQCTAYCAYSACTNNNSICSTSYANRWTCTTNGTVVYNFCDAYCNNKSMGSYFICNATQNQSSCQSECNTYVCSQTADCVSSGYNSKAACANDGNVYNTTFCSAQCLNKSLVALGNCSAGLTALQCESYCDALFCNEVACKGVATSPICASDSSIYDSTCQELCIDPNTFNLFSCQFTASVAQCASICSSANTNVRSTVCYSSCLSSPPNSCPYTAAKLQNCCAYYCYNL